MTVLTGSNLTYRCGARKGPHPCAARDLYTGPLFRVARRWAEVHAGRWWIVSGKFGLVHPDEWIPPYDETLTADKAEAWGQRVGHRLFQENDYHELGGERVVILAGAIYADALEGPLRALGVVRLEQPLRGLKIGERLAWFKKEQARG